MGASLAVCSCQPPAASSTPCTIKVVQGAPTHEAGIEKGVSACYAGVVNQKLMMAGGCNFPDVPAADGGAKRFYRGIYTASLPQGEDSLLVWEKAGELPVEAAYGVAIPTAEGLVCIGGANQDGALSTTWRISLNDSLTEARIDSLPSLPCTLDNMGGTLIGRTLYVVGGNRNGIPSNTFYALHLDSLSAGWQQLDAFPGLPRVQPICVAQRKGGEVRLFVIGGFSPSTPTTPATLQTDAIAYRPSARQWTSIEGPMGEDSATVSLGGGSGIAWGQSKIICTGGVHKDIFLSALKREQQMKQAVAAGNEALVKTLKDAGKAYMSMDIEAYRFNDKVWVYDTESDEWTIYEQTPHTARAGAIMVQTGEGFLNIQGELKPGIRTPMSARGILK